MDVDGSRARSARRAAAALMVLQAMVLAVLAAVLVIDVVRGRADSTTQALTEAALIGVFAAIAVALAHGLGRVPSWARTPTLLWNALWVPVSFSLLGQGRTLVGVFVLVVAGLSIAATVIGVRSPWDQDQGNVESSPPGPESR